MTVCRSCLEESETDWHRGCTSRLFGQRTVPRVDLDLASLHTVGLAMVGRSSMSGTQRKLSLGLSSDGAALIVASTRPRFMLKPQAQAWPHLPENEHVTMCLAADFGIQAPPVGLLTLRDGTHALVVPRFDRPAAGGKLAQEDLCQLSGQPPKHKYDGSAELVVRLVRRYASEPGVALAALFRLLLFAWWTGNGDMHLKNFSLLADKDGRHHLAPAYDLLCTRLVIPKDQQALAVGGRKNRLTAANWRALGAYAGLPERAVERILAGPGATLKRAHERIDASFLPAAMKRDYKALVTTRARGLP